MQQRSPQTTNTAQPRCAQSVIHCALQAALVALFGALLLSSRPVLAQTGPISRFATRAVEGPISRFSQAAEELISRFATRAVEGPISRFSQAAEELISRFATRAVEREAIEWLAREAVEREAIEWLDSLGFTTLRSKASFFISVTREERHVLLTNLAERSANDTKIAAVDITGHTGPLDGPINRLLRLAAPAANDVPALPSNLPVQMDLRSAVKAPFLWVNPALPLVVRYDGQLLPTRLILVGDGGFERLIEYRPHLFVRPSHLDVLAVVRRLGERPLNASDIRVLPLLENRETLDHIALRLDPQRLSVELTNEGVESAIRGQAGRIVIAVGHIENGYFKDRNGFRMRVDDLIAIGRQADVTVFPFGCNSFKATGTVGTMTDLNSIEAIDRIADARIASTVADFYSRVAAPLQGRPELLLVVDESTYVVGGRTLHVYRTAENAGHGATVLIGVGVVILPLEDEAPSGSTDGGLPITTHSAIGTSPLARTVLQSVNRNVVPARTESTPKARPLVTKRYLWAFGGMGAAGASVWSIRRVRRRSRAL